MKKLIALMIAVALIAGYSGFWYVQANHAKTFVERQISKLEKPDSEGRRLQHTGLKVSGYPFNYEVKIKNPRFGTDKNQEVFLDGFLTVGTNLWGTEFWASKSGEIHFLGGTSELDHLIISGETTFTWDIHNPNPLEAAVHPFEEFEMHPEIFKNEYFFDLVKSLRFKGKNILVKEGKGTFQNLLEVSRVLMDFSMKKPNDFERYNLSLNLQGFQMEKKAMQLLNRLALPEQPHNILFSYGKMDMELKGAVTVNKDRDLFKYLDVELDTYKVKGEFGDSELKGHFKYDDLKTPSTTAGIELDGKAKTTEDNYNYIVKTFINALQSAVQDPQNAQLSKIDNLRKLLQCCQEDLKKLVPRYHDFGLMKLTVKADAEFNKENFSGDAKVQNFDFITDIYGIKSNGFVKGQQVEIIGQYTIDLLDYKTLIEDLAAYYNRIHFVFPIFAENPEDAPPLIPHRVASLFINFLRKISNQPEKDSRDLSITINFLEPQAVKIGTLSLPDAMVEWGKFRHESSIDADK